MSLISGSRSSGSSGPRPKTSSSTSAKNASRSRHAERRRFAGQQLAEQRPDLALRARAIGLRERLEIQPVEELAVDVRLELDVLTPRLLAARTAGVGASAAEC